MGNESTQVLNNQKCVTKPQYGGTVKVNQSAGTVYQVFLVEERSLKAFMQLLQRRKTLCHPNLLTVKSFFSKENKEYSVLSCANQNKSEIYVQYIYISRTLQDLIQQCCELKRLIPQNYIKQIFSAIVSCLKYLRNNGTCHGDLKTSNILISPEKKSLLIDSYFINGGKTSYQIVLQNPSSMSLLSPEQLQKIKNRQFEENLQSVYQNEMFAVGLAMLETMIFVPAMECYDLDKLAIKENYFQSKIKRMRDRNYSPTLCNLVISCLATQKDKRPTFEQFLEIIQRH